MWYLLIPWGKFQFPWVTELRRWQNGSPWATREKVLISHLLMPNASIYCCNICLKYFSYSLFVLHNECSFRWAAFPSVIPLKVPLKVHPMSQWFAEIFTYLFILLPLTLVIVFCKTLSVSHILVKEFWLVLLQSITSVYSTEACRLSFMHSSLAGILRITVLFFMTQFGPTFSFGTHVTFNSRILGKQRGSRSSHSLQAGQNQWMQNKAKSSPLHYRASDMLFLILPNMVLCITSVQRSLFHTLWFVDANLSCAAMFFCQPFLMSNACGVRDIALDF